MSDAKTADPQFPEPHYLGRRRHWKLSDLLNYEAELRGDPAPEPLAPSEERFLTASQVRTRYGDVSDMWLWRRLHADRASAEVA